MSNPWMEQVMPGIRGLKAYEPGKPISELERELGISNIIKLASNENPLGPSPKAMEAARACLDESALYPDGNAFALKRALGDKHGVEPSQITVGSGSDHILELVARAFLGQGRSAVVSQYGFAIYNIVTQGASAELRVADAHPADHAMARGHDLAAMLALVDETTRVVFIANPNNPTGTWIERDELVAFMKKVPSDTIVLVDEAYFEYVEDPAYPNAAAMLPEYPNLVVMRTFSKAYGLAGLRVGYAMSSPEICDLLNRVRLSFNPNSIAQAAATAALGDHDHLERTVSLNRTERGRLDEGLRALGLATLPSVCNFVTVDVERPGREVFQSLLKAGVITRPLDGYGLPNHLRISVGLPEQNDRLLEALARVIADRT